MSRKPKDGNKETGKLPASDAGIDSVAAMELAERIMDADREVLRALADRQIAMARDVMARRKRALRDLAR